MSATFLQGSSLDDELKNTIKRLPLTAESLDSRGLYLFDDGFRFIIWFGRMLSPDLSKNLLGQDFAADLSRVSFSAILVCIGLLFFPFPPSIYHCK